MEEKEQQVGTSPFNAGDGASRAEKKEGKKKEDE